MELKTDIVASHELYSEATPSTPPHVAKEIKGSPHGDLVNLETQFSRTLSSTIQQLKGVRREIEALFSEQKALRKVVENGRDYPRDVKESIMKVAQRLSAIEGDVQKYLHRYEVLSKNSSSGSSDWEDEATYKRVCEDALWRMDWERTEVKSLQQILNLGRTRSARTNLARAGRDTQDQRSSTSLETSYAPVVSSEIQIKVETSFKEVLVEISDSQGTDDSM